MPRGAGVEAAAATDLAVRNASVDKNFRQVVKNLFQANGGRLVNNYTESWADGTQSSVLLWERADGVKGIGQIEGDIRNIPLCLRGKRNVEALEEENNNQEEAALIDGGDAARFRKKSKRATTGKKATAPRKKKVAAVPAPAAADAAGDGAPAAPARAAGTRRSSRVSSANARRNVFQDDPIPEEEEFHPIVKDEGDDLADIMNDFEIASNAGTESTRVYSREHSRAMSHDEPVASTSRLAEPIPA